MASELLKLHQLLDCVIRNVLNGDTIEQRERCVARTRDSLATWVANSGPGGKGGAKEAAPSAGVPCRSGRTGAAAAAAGGSAAANADAKSADGGSRDKRRRSRRPRCRRRKPGRRMRSAPVICRTRARTMATSVRKHGAPVRPRLSPTTLRRSNKQVWPLQRRALLSTRSQQRRRRRVWYRCGRRRPRWNSRCSPAQEGTGGSCRRDIRRAKHG